MTVEIVIEIDNDPGAPAYRRLAEAIRVGILSGRFRPGEKLPPTRTLASSLSLARNTVLEAYDQLIAEGYLSARHGSGTFIANELPERAAQAAPTPAPEAPSSAISPLSAYGRRVVHGEAPAQARRASASNPYEFRYGTPSFDEFPMDAWRSLTRRVLDYPSPDLMGYGPPEGLPQLREALARYLQRSRGVRCSAEQVMVVNGSQQALDLASRVLLDPGDEVVIEDPCYPGARAVLAANGGELVPVGCDEEGLVVSAIPDGPRLAYVTPSHQFPSGVVMSAPRRLELLAWAEKTDAVILEDDYDSEFRYEGRPLAALQGLDTTGRVVYTGTLSKVLLPSLRLGYMVAPPQVQPALSGAKWLTDRHVALLYQAVLALFIDEGHFERHLRRMRKVYSRRREALIEAFEQHFGARARVLGAQSGLHVLVHIEDIPDETAFMASAAASGVGVYSARGCFSEAAPPGASFLMGYSSVTEDGIREGIRLLAKVAG